MFRSSGFARFGRIVLLVAGLAAVSGSFGLHPEPQDTTAPAGGGIGWVGPHTAENSTSHACLACLAHRSVPLPRLSAVILAPQSAAPAGPAAPAASLRRLEGHASVSRAPPSLG
jgi:hypothetical protein